MSTQSTASASATGGVGFIGLLTVAFIVLKLTGIITWSWLWVLAPLWMPWAIAFALLTIGAIIALGFFLFSIITNKPKMKR